MQEGIVLRRKISNEGIEVDIVKTTTIEKLPPPTSVRAIRSFLGHVGFYWRFIQDFVKIAKPLIKLLEKNDPFDFNTICLLALNTLKNQLIQALIMTTPNWSLSIKLLCDVNNHAVGVVLGQRKDKHFHPVYYAR